MRATDVELVPLPAQGRRFTGSRKVRLGDADARGRLRLDALARLLQDVGNDDTTEAGLDDDDLFVVRRTTFRVERWPRLGEQLTLATFCGAIGSHWAERRTSVSGDQGGRVEAAALWVHVDRGTMRPARISGQFKAIYGEATGGRTVPARLRHPDPPSAPTAGQPGAPWPVRAVDLDVMGHVNNAATWGAVEEELSRRGLRPRVAEMEYRAAIAPDDVVVLRADTSQGEGEGNTEGEGPELRVWLIADGEVRASAVLR